MDNMSVNRGMSTCPQSPLSSSMHPDDPALDHYEQYSGMECEDVKFLISDHDSESEISEEEADVKVEDDEENLTGASERILFYGRDKTFKWSKSPTTNVRTRKDNIVTTFPGLQTDAKRLGDNPKPEDVWGLLLTEDMCEEILKWTNLQISRVRPNYTDTHSCLNDMTMLEFRALLGLLVFTEIFKSGNEDIDQLFASNGKGRDVFRCTMPKRRFEFLISCLCFDNPDDREEREKLDEAAAISSIFQKFIDNAQRSFCPGPMMCADEMLVAFSGRCRFKIYMPLKPAKSGIKIQCLTDAKNSYLYNAYIYSGKESDGKHLSNEEKRLSIPTQSVIRLSKPIQHTNRNITADNWFSSVELANELKKRGLTYLGTMKKKKMEIPGAFLSNKNRDVTSSLYGFTNELTLLSYVPRKSKAVVLISSMHHGNQVDSATREPEIIAEYNRTKEGVDNLDRKCANHSPSRRTNRWSMAIFYALLNISAANAYNLYQHYTNTAKIARTDFLGQLADNLVQPYMHHRLHTRIPKELRMRIETILGISSGSCLNDIEQREFSDDRLETKKTCAFCSYRLKRKTFYVCRRCSRPICLEHTRKICSECCFRDDDK